MIKAASSQDRVAVITPYHGEDLAYITQCHQSVLAQTYPALHVLVADGSPLPEISSWQAHHVILPVCHGDIGSTPRLIGSYHAIGLGMDAIAFLDADNWYAPNHLANLMEARQHDKAEFVSSGRMLCRLDGTAMAPCTLINPQNFIDTNCMLFSREAYPLLHHWVLMPNYGHLIGDRIMFHHIRQSGMRHSHISEPTVNYRCGKEGLYRLLGEQIPMGVQPRPDFDSSFRQWEDDGNPPLAR